MYASAKYYIWIEANRIITDIVKPKLTNYVVPDGMTHKEYKIEDSMVDYFEDDNYLMFNARLWLVRSDVLLIPKEDNSSSAISIEKAVNYLGTVKVHSEKDKNKKLDISYFGANFDTMYEYLLQQKVISYIEGLTKASLKFSCSG